LNLNGDGRAAWQELRGRLESSDMENIPDAPAPVDDCADGQWLKESVRQLLAVRRARFVRLAQRALLECALNCGAATTNDVLAMVALPEGVSAACLGAVPGPLARLCIIRRIGFVDSARARTHGRPVSVWELADRAAALAWLNSHPPIPAPEGE
jgi:hypothetical protein